VHRCFFASLALALLPAPAGAERFQYGGRSEVFWTDNVFGTTEDPIDDEVARIAPWADLEDHEGRVTWGLRYAPSYDYYLDQSSLRGFDHDVSGRFGWQLGDRTSFSVSDRFQRYHSVTTFNDQAEPGQDVITVGQRQRFKVNNVNGSLDHWLGPVDRVSLSVSQSLFDFSDENQSDSTFLGANVTYDHTLSERTTVGTRFSWGRQTTDRFDVSDDVTDYYNLSGVLSYTYSPTLQLSLSAGPALIQGNEDDFDAPENAAAPVFPLFRKSDGLHFLDANTCPEESPGVRVVGLKCNTVGPPVGVAGNQGIFPFVGTLPGVDDSNTTYFASATLSKQWERWSGALSYTRSAGQSTRIASVSDVVSGSLNWQIARRWTADLSGSFERREQANQNFVLSPEVVSAPSPAPGVFPGQVARTIAVRAVEVDSGAGVDVITANFRIAYQVASSSSLYLSADWNEQSGTGDLSSVEGSQRLALTVGVNYYFDPVSF
jgi:hypothetical protein